MRRIGIAVLIAMLMLALSVATAFATSPHFVGTPSATLQGSSLLVKWKEAGLGSTPVSVTYNISATASATYRCYTKSGNHPKASNKVGPETITTTPTLTSGKNGEIDGSVLLSPPSADGFSCPSGQVLFLDSATYSNVSITDTTNSVGPVSISGTFQFCRPGAVSCP